jgi:hypothetical protein
MEPCCAAKDNQPHDCKGHDNGLMVLRPQARKEGIGLPEGGSHGGPVIQCGKRSERGVG